MNKMKGLISTGVILCMFLTIVDAQILLPIPIPGVALLPLMGEAFIKFGEMITSTLQDLNTFQRQGTLTFSSPPSPPSRPENRCDFDSFKKLTSDIAKMIPAKSIEFYLNNYTNETDLIALNIKNIMCLDKLSTSEKDVFDSASKFLHSCFPNSVGLHNLQSRAQKLKEILNNNKLDSVKKSCVVLTALRYNDNANNDGMFFKMTSALEKPCELICNV